MSWGFFLIEYSLRSSRRGFELEVRVRSEFRLLSYHKVSDTAPLSFDFPPEINQLSNIKLSSHTQFRDQALQNREYLAAGGAVSLKSRYQGWAPRESLGCTGRNKRE